MKDNNCGYCMRNELLDAFGIYICDLRVSSLILFKEQSKPGRVIVAYKDHVSEIVNISEEERNLFMADVTRAAKGGENKELKENKKNNIINLRQFFMEARKNNKKCTSMVAKLSKPL